MATPRDPSLERLDRMIGAWNTEMTHPAMPGVVVRGSVNIEWLEGRRFVIHRSRTDHADFPDSISIIGFTQRDRVDADGKARAPADEPMSVHYFDSRGVFRVLDATIDDEALRFVRIAPGFSQRYTGRFADGDHTLLGQWEMSEDGVHWRDDLQITYRRA